MSRQLYSAQGVQPPTVQQLTEINNKLGLGISEEELPQHKGLPILTPR